MTTGLVLGKFAPLHKGHQLLIDIALAENEQVAVVIYDSPEVTNVPLPVRANWIRQLYPNVQIYEAWGGPTEVGDDPELQRQHELYLLRILGDRKISAFYSSEFYGQHVSSALGAIDRRIDSARSQVPISATAIRNNVYQNRAYLSPTVYRDLVTKIVFLGAPSTGKTTLARELAARRNTVWVPEYGREYWEQHQIDRRLSPEQLLEIAEGHRQREETALSQANRELFIDTDATTTCAFAMSYHGAVAEELQQWANECSTRYDLFFLCDLDIPYEDTWDRSGDCHRTIFQQQIIADLLRRKTPYVTLSGSLEQRIGHVETILKNFDRFQSLGNQLLRCQL